MARILREFGLRTQIVHSVAAAPTDDSNSWLLNIVSTGAVDRMHILTCRVARIPTVESIEYHEIDPSGDKPPLREVSPSTGNFGRSSHIR